MRAQTTLLGGVLLAIAATVAVPAGAQAPRAAKPHAAKPHARIHVTGHRLPLSSYLAQGLDVRQAQVQAQLDELAHEGLDPAMLTRSAAAMDTVVLSSSNLPEASVFLSEGGRLAGRTNAVLEQRFIPGKDKQVIQLVVRNGLTGTVLWSRKDTLPNEAYQVAIPAAVGARGQAGVILLRDDFSPGGGRTLTLVGLDGRGKQLWTRGLAQSATKTSSGFSFTSTFLQFGRHLRGGPLEIAATRGMTRYDDSQSGTHASGSVTFGAVSQATGAVRALGGGLSSPDGAVTGGFVTDHSGDGYEDVVAVDGGSSSRVVLSRGIGGTQIWARTDIPANGYGFLEEVGVLTGSSVAGKPVQDLALTTAPQAGVVGDPLGLLPDPTAATHGNVTLLTGATGASKWTKVGDNAYPLESVKGAPALGVATDNSTSSPTSTTAEVQIDVLDVAGTTLWSRTATLDVPHSATSQDDYYSFAFAGTAVDLDEDKGYEGYAYLVVIDSSTDEEKRQVSLYRSADGSAVKDADSDFFDGSVTGKGEDRTRVTVTKRGVTVTLTHGVQATPLFTRLLPRTAGATSGYLYGYRLGAARCEDGLFGAGGKNHGVVGVLASNGEPRWVVSRAATDQALGTVVAPRTPPHPAC